jgi:hypothetical protein
VTVAELTKELEAEQALGSELEKYAGQWVAVKDHTVVAHATTLQGLLEQVTEDEDTVVLRVPEDPNTACFF